MNKTESLQAYQMHSAESRTKRKKIKLLTCQMKQFRNTFSSIARAYDSIFISQRLSLLFSSADKVNSRE